MNVMKKLLLVEDDPKIAYALKLRLTHMGFEVETAGDAVYAMDQALRQAPDVVLLDINLPGGNGFVVAERLKQASKTAGVPIVFITASKESEYKARAREVGASAFLEKPFSASQLSLVLERCLGDAEQGQAAA